MLCTRVLPALKHFHLDNDKIPSICSNISYYLITPALKTHSSSRASHYAVSMLMELSKVSTVSKIWDPIVTESFADANFFTRSTEILRWKSLVHIWLRHNKNHLNDLLGECYTQCKPCLLINADKVVTAPSANIFANKEHDMHTRALALRRLSFVIWSAGTNELISQLPGIQAKLIENFRGSHLSASVHGQAFFCLRILILRVSPVHLATFWPIIAIELVRFTLEK